MYCQNCGAEQVQSSRFCTSCGASFTSSGLLPGGQQYASMAYTQAGRFVIAIGMVLGGLLLFIAPLLSWIVPKSGISGYGAQAKSGVAGPGAIVLIIGIAVIALAATAAVKTDITWQMSTAVLGCSILALIGILAQLVSLNSFTGESMGGPTSFTVGSGLILAGIAFLLTLGFAIGGIVYGRKIIR